mgnify:CR=1 FL=1
MSARRVMLRALEKRSLSLDGHKTAVALEPIFWIALEAEADLRKTTVSRLISSLRKLRQPGQGVASCVRCFLLNTYIARNAQNKEQGGVLHG